MTDINLDIDDFLKNFWQQKPLLIRQAFADFKNPVSADELAGLACEELVESRLITEASGQWTLQHGPIDEHTFSQLPEKDWTLLVQAVDHWVPEVAQLLNHFRFIPNWRIDDVMASYAAQGGSVGPHYDNYDVFLLQGAGKRHWQLGTKYNSDSVMQENEQLRLLASFEPEQDWILEPGDMLYVPPQYGHWGTATNSDCMTYSIGFRAPSHSEVITEFCDYQLSKLKDELRYSDPQLPLQINPGEIQAQAIDQIQQVLLAHIADKNTISQWFGRQMTRPKYNHDNLNEEQLNDKDITRLLTQHKKLFRDSSSRFAYSFLDNQFYLFVNGESFICVDEQTQALSKILCKDDHYPNIIIQSLISSSESFNLIKELTNQGHLFFEGDITNDFYG
jgi:50S ribosomal protein L16 3-hydroxylase